jgi:diadenylate cyclase
MAERFRQYRTLLAPGTPLRDGLERIVNGRTGALVVLGDNVIVDQISTGGFTIDTEFTPTALRELAKMDGGIVVSADLDRILRAGVHFVPSGSIETIETGTRHRTADRIAQQAHVPVATVSASMSTIALFLEGMRYPIEPSNQIMVRADQALATLSRYRDRLTADTRYLTGLEIGDLVMLRDLVRVGQRVEMTRRLAEELEGYVEALGVDGRLLQLQLFELTAGVDETATLLETDYATDGRPGPSLTELDRLPTGELLDPASVASALGFEGTPLDTHLRARGYRLINQAAQLENALATRLLSRVESIQELFDFSVDDLMAIDGIDDKHARALRDGLARLAELGTQS